MSYIQILPSKTDQSIPVMDVQTMRRDAKRDNPDAPTVRVYRVSHERIAIQARKGFTYAHIPLSFDHALSIVKAICEASPEVAERVQEYLTPLTAPGYTLQPTEEDSGVKHTSCRKCELDIEGFAPYPAGEWRDRGNNATCLKGGNHKPI
jgi:hypothetical protein